MRMFVKYIRFCFPTENKNFSYSKRCTKTLKFNVSQRKATHKPHAKYTILLAIATFKYDSKK